MSKRTWTDQDLQKTIPLVKTFKELYKALGVWGGLHTSRLIRHKIVELNLDISHFENIVSITQKQLGEIPNIKRLKELPLEELKALYEKHGSKSGVFEELGISKQDGRVRAVLRERLGSLDVPKPPIAHTRESIEKAFASAKCWSDVYRSVGLSACDHNKKAIVRAAESYSILIPSFEKTKHETYSRGKERREIEDIFVENSSYSRGALRLVVLKLGILGEYKCSECGQLPIWQGKPLTIELDHRNGVNNDNRIENLRWMCKHCHSQTETYKNKNSRDKDSVED